MKPWLAIDYGAAVTQAVLLRADGSWQVLQVDGGTELSSAVYVSDGGVAVGAEAWRRAAVDSDGFVLSPLRAGTGQLTLGGTTVDAADLAAATLRQLAAEATRVAAEPVTQALMLVPAGWGPRRRTWLRHVARQAGLEVSRLVEVPVAAATSLVGPPVSSVDAAQVLLVIDVGAGCEVSVVRRNAQSAEVLATLEDPAAGGDRIDALLAEALLGAVWRELPAAQRWTALAMVRITKQALADQVAVTMAVPGGAGPLVVHSAQLAQVAQPVLERVGQLAAEAVEAADLTLAEVHGVHLIGGVAAMPGAAQMTATKLGIIPQVPRHPALAAVVGACASAPGRASDGGEPLRLPPWRRLLFFAVPGAVSLLLFVHFVLGADVYGARPLGSSRGPFYQLIAAWPELTMAAVLAQVCLLQAASLFAALLDSAGAFSGGRGSGSRITAGIGIAVVAGPAIAVLYAVTAAAYFTCPYAWTLPWALWPTLPTAVCAALVAVVAWRRRAIPAGGWDAFLAFPGSSLIAATVGIVSATLWAHVGMPYWLSGWGRVFGYLGGLLVAIGIACALARRLALRAGLGFALGLSLMLLAVTVSGYRLLGVLFAGAVALWWLKRLWALLSGPR